MFAERFFRVAMALVLLGFVIHRGWHIRALRVRGAKTATSTPGQGRPVLASGLGVVASVAGLFYLVYPAPVSWAALGLPAWVRVSGVLLGLAGLVLIAWAQRSLGAAWDVAAEPAAGDLLVTRGPYRYVRHPIYTGFLLVFGSTLLVSSNALVGGLFIAMSGVEVAGRVRAEEKSLLERFGTAYGRYMETTGRLLPRLYRHPRGRAL